MALSPLTILLLLHIPFVCASLPSFNGTGISVLNVSESPSCGNTRSLSDIIWSCAATLFACTWTAIHPNIPGMKEWKVTVLSRRLGIMIIVLILPELMITWATLQFLSARDTAKDFNDAFGAQLHRTCGDNLDIEESTALLLSNIPQSGGRDSPHLSAPHAAGQDGGWTATHGFFAWMGGFMLYVKDKPRTTLRPDELLRFVREGFVDVPVIMEADIEDRSKGDALSKGIAVLQLAWFVLQLVARYTQNLPITLLEIDTLALAALTSISYGFWWKKPKDVGRPYAVHWKATSPPSKLAYDETDSIFSLQDCSDHFLSYIYPLFNLMGTDTFISLHAVRECRVPSLGGYDNHDIYDRNHSITLSIGGCSGMMFGGIHCLGWNVFFQAHTEQILWRAASLAIVSAPVSILLLFSLIIWWKGSNDVGHVIAMRAIFASIFIYIVARVTLIVLLLMSLRLLPPGVYDTVTWTKFIPHF